MILLKGEFIDLIKHCPETIRWGVFIFLFFSNSLFRVILPEKSVYAGPYRFHDAIKAVFHLFSGLLTECMHIVYLGLTHIRVSPGTGNDPESLHREINSRFIGSFIVPIANDHFP